MIWSPDQLQPPSSLTPLLLANVQVASSLFQVPVVFTFQRLLFVNFATNSKLTQLTSNDRGVIYIVVTYFKTLVVIVPSPSMSNSRNASLISSTCAVRITTAPILTPYQQHWHHKYQHHNIYLYMHTCIKRVSNIYQSMIKVDITIFTWASDSSTPAITLSLKTYWPIRVKVTKH